jgi:fucose permease
MTGLLVLLPILFFIIIRFPRPKQLQGFPIAQGLGLIKKTTLLLLAFVLFFESGIEVTMSSWTTTFLKEELSIDAALSVTLLSFYGIGMVIARIILGYALKKVSSSKLLISSFLISFVFTWVMIVSNNPYLTVPALFVIGAGCAAVFPVVLSYIGDLYPRLSGTAFSITFVIALIGGTIFPLCIGVIADTYNLRFAFLIIPLGIIIMILLFGILKKNRLKAMTI